MLRSYSFCTLWGLCLGWAGSVTTKALPPTCHVMSGLFYHSETIGQRNWGEIVQAMMIVWFITCIFLEICLWASWSEFYICWETVLSTFFHLLSFSQTRKAWYKSLIHLKANNSWESESEVVQSCPTLCDPMDCSLPGSSVHGILQARVLEWVDIFFSRGSSWPRDGTQVSRIPGIRFNLWATREANNSWEKSTDLS